MPKPPAPPSACTAVLEIIDAERAAIEAVKRRVVIRRRAADAPLLAGARSGY
jgi:hypothetical protein